MEDMKPKEEIAKVPKKLHSRLANTLAIQAKCGTMHNDIDQPMRREEAINIRDKAKTICNCKSPEKGATQEAKRNSKTSQICIACGKFRQLRHLLRRKQAKYMPSMPKDISQVTTQRRMLSAL